MTNERHLDGIAGAWVRRTETERDKEARRRQTGKGHVDAIAAGAKIHFGHSAVAEQNRLEFVKQAERLQNAEILRSIDDFTGATLLCLRGIEAQLNAQHEWMASVSELLTEIVSHLQPTAKRKRTRK